MSAFEVGMNAGENFDQGAFARAILPGQNVDLARAAFELDIPQHRDLPESLGDAGHAHQWRLVGSGIYVYWTWRMSSVPDFGS